MKALLLALLTAILLSSVQAETPAEKDARMKWWKEARFGLFLHWGSYSVAAGEWNGKDNYAEWIREEAHIPLPQYEQLAKQFNPVKFDADKWVTMAKNAGMKYIVITSKHHEGFNMFASKYTDYNIMNSPFHRDPMKELATACRRHGMKFCFYHSIMDWHHPDYLPRRSWEDRPVDGADFNRFVQYLHNDVTQLLTEYGPIGVMWFDGQWENTWNDALGQDLYDLCRKLQPNVIVNNRVGHTGKVGDYGTPEQYIPAQGIPGTYWETCMTMNDHWGYNKNDHNYKSSESLVRRLVDIASKGGNYLLNIGPTAEGEFPPEAQERLADLGKWMKVNGQAIYDTDASPFPALAWGRCTQARHGSRTTLYLDVFDWPSDGKLVVPGLGNRPVHAHMLAASGQSLAVHRQGSDLVVDVPPAAPDSSCSVVALDVEGAPVVYATPTIEAATDLVAQPVKVTIDSSTKSAEVRYTLDGSEPSATSPVYGGPFEVNQSVVVRARQFANGRPVSSIAERAFRSAELWPEKPFELNRAPEPGLLLDVYKGDWDTVPDFDSLAPESKGVMREIGISLWPAREHFGIRLTGWIEVPEDGVYNFELSSDDGSKLWIDDRQVVDNDGLHSMTPVDGSAPLHKGKHQIRIGYFNKTGDLGLSLKWGLAGAPLETVPLGSLWH